MNARYVVATSFEKTFIGSIETLGSYSKYNKTLRSVHFGVVVLELINSKCRGIVRNEIW